MILYRFFSVGLNFIYKESYMRSLSLAADNCLLSVSVYLTYSHPSLMFRSVRSINGT